MIALLLPLVALPGSRAGLAPTEPGLEFEHELDAGGVCRLHVEDRGTTLHVWLEAELDDSVARRSVPGWVGAWSVAGPHAVLEGDELGSLALEPAGAGSGEGHVLYRSRTWTLGLGDVDPVELAFTWSVADEKHSDGARIDGLADAELVGWTHVRLDGLRGRACFYESAGGCAVHLALANETGEARYFPGPAPEVLDARFSYAPRQHAEEASAPSRRPGPPPRGDAAPSRGPLPVTRADRDAWKMVPGEVRRFVFRMPIERSGEQGGAGPPAEWNLYTELPVAVDSPPTLHPRRWERRWLRFERSAQSGISVATGTRDGLPR